MMFKNMYVCKDRYMSS